MTDKIVNVYSVYGRPDANLTKEKWEKIYKDMKMEVASGKATVCNTSQKYENTIYHCTNIGQYASFLKEIEREIRRNGTEYLYFGYQVWDMLFRFKDQLDKLECEYAEEYGCYIMRLAN